MNFYVSKMKEILFNDLIVIYFSIFNSKVEYLNLFKFVLIHPSSSF